MLTMVFSAIAITVIINSLAVFSVVENRAARFKYRGEMAFQIAEAGVEYYRWHLSHAPADYFDGTGFASSTYGHDYKDKNNVVIGRFELQIIPPATGSTVVTIVSTGYTLVQPDTKRKIKARVGFPSLADYSILTNSSIWIGDSEVVHGTLHSNGGIRFDGTSDAAVTSAKETYVCDPVFGSGCQHTIKPGIWGDGTPQDLWQFPVPAYDFDMVTFDLSQIKEGAEDGGAVYSSSGVYGYHVVFTSSSVYSLYKVTSLRPLDSPGYGQDTDGNRHYESYDILDEELQGTYANPANGLMFFEDQVWVEGTVKGRITVGSGKFPINPTTYTSIIIPNSIVYTTKNGTDALGLIAQNHILVPRWSPDVLEMDAAIIAQYGSAQRFYYQGNILDSLTVYGTVISNGIWTWSWVTQGGSVVSGYRNTNFTHDANLVYGPPPSFPVGTENHLISWEEIK